MIRTLYEDPRASHGSTLWCNQLRQTPGGTNLARRVPHRLHRLPAEKPSVGQGLREPEAHRQRPAGFPRGQVRLICQDVSVPPLPSPPRSHSPRVRPLLPHRKIRSGISGQFFGVLGAPHAAGRQTVGPGTQRWGSRRMEEWGYLTPYRGFPGWGPGGEQRALPRSTHRVARRSSRLSAAAPPGDHRSSISGNRRSGQPEMMVSQRATRAPELREGDGEAGETRSSSGGRLLWLTARNTFAGSVSALRVRSLLSGLRSRPSSPRPSPQRIRCHRNKPIGCHISDSVSRRSTNSSRSCPLRSGRSPARSTCQCTRPALLEAARALRSM
jgi:hypothetical protein